MSRAEGMQGEALVARYLRERGYQLAAHGYRSRYGEIDLIAWDGDVLCFVEVKTRTNLDMALPREYVTPQKQNKLQDRQNVSGGEAAGLSRPVRCGRGLRRARL